MLSLLACDKEKMDPQSCQKGTMYDRENKVIGISLIKFNSEGKQISINSILNDIKENYEYYSSGLLKKKSRFKKDILELTEEYEYDNLERKTKYTFLPNLPNVSSFYINYEYNSKGQLNKSSRFSLSNQLIKYSTFEYNDAGKLIKENIFSSDDVFSGYRVYEYDGLTVKESYYEKRSTTTSFKLLRSVITTYNDKNKEIEIIVNVAGPMPNDELRLDYSYKYEYNSSNNPTKVYLKQYNIVNEKYDFREYLIEYDANQKKTKETAYVVSAGVSGLMYKIIYEYKCD
jgi:hypothetical protein